MKVRCPTCGVRVERLDFLGKHARVTKDLHYQTGQLCKVMPVQAVATFEWLNWETVKEIDKRTIEKAQEERDLSGITVLGVDEISVGKGHSYWHMVSTLEGPTGPEVLYVGEGRKEKDLEAFWQWFGKEKAKKVTYGVMDMARGVYQ